MGAEVYAKATYDFKATHPDDLPLREGDIVIVLHQDPSGWWSGQSLNGKKGIFPYNFVQIIDPKEREIPQTPGAAKGNTLKLTDNADRVKKVRVNRLRLRKKTPELSIEVVTSGDAGTIEAVKSIAELRRLASFLKSIGKTVSKKLPPQWADRSDISESSNKYRAVLFQDFLRELTGNSTQEYALVRWMDAKANFKTSDEVKKRVDGKLEAARPPSYNIKDAPILARAMYDWKQRDELELEIFEEEIIAVITRKTQYDGWWMGENTLGKRGIFPFNYVQMLSPEEAERFILGGVTDSVKMGKEQAITPTKKLAETKTKQKATGKAKEGTTKKFLIGSTEAFDHLVHKGYAMEELNGDVAKVPSADNCPKKGDFVIVKFTAYTWVPQSQEIVCFEDNQDEPLEFKVGSNTTVPGLQKAIQKMEKGQLCRVIIAPEQGYGEVGNPPKIPPNAHIVYDITLEDIMKKGGGGRESTFFTGVAASAVATRPIRSSVQFYNPDALKKDKLDRSKPTQTGAVQPTLLKKKPDFESKKNSYTLAKLKEVVASGDPRKHGVDMRNVEEYLTDGAFEEAFGVDRITFMLMPAFRQRQLKSENGLSIS